MYLRNISVYQTYAKRIPQFEKNRPFKSFKRFILNSDDVLHCSILVLSWDSLILFRNVVARSKRCWQGVTGAFDPDDLHPTYPGAGDIYSRTLCRDTRWLESPLELREQRNYWKLCDRLIVRLRVHVSELALKSLVRSNKNTTPACLALTSWIGNTHFILNNMFITGDINPT